MILGLGLDLVSLPRMERSLERFGHRLLCRVLTDDERVALPAAPGPRTAYVAARFAAKEATVKALGTGFAAGVGPLDVEVLSLPSGKPEVRLRGAAARRAGELGAGSVHISLTHERDTAAAVVILEG